MGELIRKGFAYERIGESNAFFTKGEVYEGIADGLLTDNDFLTENDPLPHRVDPEYAAEHFRKTTKPITRPAMPPEKSVKTADPVNYPSHYTQGGVECIDALKAAMSQSEFEGFLRANSIKYLWRFREKNGVEDLKKAKWYLERLISELEKQ